MTFNYDNEGKIIAAIQRRYGTKDVSLVPIIDCWDEDEIEDFNIVYYDVLFGRTILSRVYVVREDGVYSLKEVR